MSTRRFASMCFCTMGVLFAVLSSVAYGVTPTVAKDPSSHPRLLQPLDEGQLAAARAQTSVRGQNLLQAAQSQFVRGPNADFKLQKTTVDVYGMTHARLQVTYKGVPVMGDFVVGHAGRNGETLPFTGHPLDLSGLDVDPQPGLSSAKAEEIVRANLAPEKTEPLPPKLVIKPILEEVVRPEAQGRELNAEDVKSRASGLQLVYIIVAPVRSNLGFHDWVYELAAKDGTILSRTEGLRHVGPNGHSQYSGDVYVPATPIEGGYKLVDSTRGNGHPNSEDHHLVHPEYTGGNTAWSSRGHDISDLNGEGYVVLYTAS